MPDDRLMSSHTATRRSMPLLVLVLAIGALACSSNEAVPRPAENGGQLEWVSCDGVECAELAVPYDYSAPSTGTFSLKLSRQRALKPEERIGVLVVNPGGPGAPGTSLAQNAAFYFSREILDRFDIVAWDPRGTGKSTPAIDCIDDYDDYFAEQLTAQNAQRFIDGCIARSGDVLAHVGTLNSARDIEAIRVALGEEEISYFGFSYGGVLGLVWRAMFPDTVRAVVLDAPPNPVADRAERIAGQAAEFENLLNEFLNERDLASTWNSLVVNPPSRLTKHIILTAAISALYDEASWPELEDALVAATAGDPQPIIDMFRGFYYQDPGFEDLANTFEASIAISCVDDVDNVPLGDLSTLAPRLAQFFAGDDLCRRWPVRTTERPNYSTNSMMPIIIIAATDDPAAPFPGALVATQIAGNARLITVEARRHTSYFAVSCVTELVDAYLVDLVAVPDTTCSPDPKTATTASTQPGLAK